LSVDASTICGENILAIKAKFLEKQFDKETKEDLTIIQNKIVRIKTFGEKSTGKDIHKAIEDKLFSNEQIKNNLIGVVHDNASSLTGENIGLLAILKKNNEKLFDLKDPCHGLSLAVNHAIDTLPKRIMGFVSKIHSFFISPQRTASLTRIQLENMKPIKKLKKFVKTRWLSLGISLDRLLEIWESLGLYMKESLQAKNTKEVQKKLKRFESQLRNDCFHLQLKFLAYIINKTNYFNEIFQNQSLPIEKLKETLTTSYKTILRLVVPLEKISNDNICKFLTFDWKDEKIQEEWFVNDVNFIEASSKLAGLTDLKKLNSSDQKNICQVFKCFFGTILNKLPEYLPLQDPLVDTLDFVELSDEAADFEKKK